MIYSTNEQKLKYRKIEVVEPGLKKNLDSSRFYINFPCHGRYLFSAMQTGAEINTMEHEKRTLSHEKRNPTHKKKSEKFSINIQ
jgi:hypothetical protein